MISWIMVCVRTVAFTISINNERAGYFKGGRGLRQGDPISPYIFMLVMEVFTLILQKYISEDAKFKVVKRALDMFSSISGINPNIGKSTVVFGNVKEHDKIDILTTLPFKIGSLPVSYLGALVFIIPKYVVKDINKLLKGFPLCQGNLSKGKAKVAWKQVCKPKDEGGLGIKDLSSWNEVLMAKHLWNVASMKESLWVKRINEARLKGNSIWEIECDKNSSYG
ncbi:RNA-directed DNA polymerase, eukaryota, reverse transcriptase zinc-binding domain protein [Tanacetum coccineum]